MGGQMLELLQTHLHILFSVLVSYKFNNEHRTQNFKYPLWLFSTMYSWYWILFISYTKTCSGDLLRISPLLRYTITENFQNQLQMVEFNWHLSIPCLGQHSLFSLLGILLKYLTVYNKVKLK